MSETIALIAAIIGAAVLVIFCFVGFMTVLSRIVDPADSPYTVRNKCILAEKLTPGCEIILKAEKK